MWTWLCPKLVPEQVSLEEDIRRAKTLLTDSGYRVVKIRGPRKSLNLDLTKVRPAETHDPSTR